MALFSHESKWACGPATCVSKSANESILDDPNKVSTKGHDCPHTSSTVSITIWGLLCISGPTTRARVGKKWIMDELMMWDSNYSSRNDKTISQTKKKNQLPYSLGGAFFLPFLLPINKVPLSPSITANLPFCFYIYIYIIINHMYMQYACYFYTIFGNFFNKSERWPND